MSDTPGPNITYSIPDISRLACQSSASCHPFLTIFGLIYVTLYLFLVIVPTICDNADRYKRRKGPLLDTFGGERRRNEVDLEKGGEGSGKGFREVKYESRIDLEKKEEKGGEWWHSGADMSCRS
ncbi:hypothetical protein ACLMJK_005799 [Lecanora helva]